MANRWRIACNAVTDEDASRIMDWLDLALEQRHPEFLAGYLRWDILPEDRAWRIRHAERLALFNQRFEAAYLDGVYAGELSMLDLAWRLYAIEKVLPKTDPYRAFVFNHAADLAARDQLGMRRQYSESIRRGARRGGADLRSLLCRSTHPKVRAGQREAGADKLQGFEPQVKRRAFRFLGALGCRNISKSIQDVCGRGRRTGCRRARLDTTGLRRGRLVPSEVLQQDQT